jgi:hypothetical protein
MCAPRVRDAVGGPLTNSCRAFAVQYADDAVIEVLAWGEHRIVGVHCTAAERGIATKMKGIAPGRSRSWQSLDMGRR